MKYPKGTMAVIDSVPLSGEREEAGRVTNIRLAAWCGVVVTAVGFVWLAVWGFWSIAGAIQ